MANFTSDVAILTRTAAILLNQVWKPCIILSNKSIIIIHPELYVKLESKYWNAHMSTFCRFKLASTIN